MICPICKQDGICYVELSDGKHFRCSVCKRDFTDLDSLLEINFSIEEAYLEGKKAFGEEGSFNPYKDSEKGDDPILSRSWEKGYFEERAGYELEALLISSEKLKEERDKEISILTDKILLYEDKISLYKEGYGQNLYWIGSLKHSKLVKVPIFGKIYIKKIEELLERLHNFYQERICNNPDE